MDLFIVGFGRSGTKLIRNILNQHPQITIAQSETNFLPAWIREWSAVGDISAAPAFKRFYLRALREPFFQTVARNDNLVAVEDWYNRCGDFSLAGVYRALLSFYIDAEKPIWGDKSPSHTRHIFSISGIYPRARFLHIFRDGRDCSLSARTAWGSNIYRNMQRWRDVMMDVDGQAGALPASRYLAIRYEDLLENSRDTVAAVCTWLDVPFIEGLTELERPAEAYGEAKGLRHIKSDNRGRFRAVLKAEEIERLTTIGYDALFLLTYPTDNVTQQRSVSPLRMKLYRVADGFRHLTRNIRERGIVEAFRFTFSYFRLNLRSGQ